MACRRAVGCAIVRVTLSAWGDLEPGASPLQVACFYIGQHSTAPACCGAASLCPRCRHVIRLRQSDGSSTQVVRGEKQPHPLK